MRQRWFRCEVIALPRTSSGVVEYLDVPRPMRIPRPITRPSDRSSHPLDCPTGSAGRDRGQMSGCCGAGADLATPRLIDAIRSAALREEAPAERIGTVFVGHGSGAQEAAGTVRTVSPLGYQTAGGIHTAGASPLARSGRKNRRLQPRPDLSAGDVPGTPSPVWRVTVTAHRHAAVGRGYTAALP